MRFSMWKRVIFRKIKEIKDLSGGIVLYAAQSNPRVDAEIAEKGRFQTKINSNPLGSDLITMGLPFLFASYAAGLGIAPYFYFSPLSTFAALISAVIWLIFRRRRWSSSFLLLTFLLTGFSLYHLSLNPPADGGHIRAYISERPVAIQGIALNVSSRYPDRTVIDLDTERVVLKGIAAPVNGRLRLYLDGPCDAVLPGDRIRFHSRLKAPRPFGTPGEFDFSRYLAFRKIFVTAFLPSDRGLVKMPGPRSNPTPLIAKARRHIADAIEAAAPEETSPLLKALIIGDKGSLSPELRDLLARGGISHLFSISGLHLGLLALFLYTGFRFLYRRSETLLLQGPPIRVLPAILVPFLLFYLLLTGNALPTRRAFLMAAAAALLLLGRRRTPPLHLLVSAAFLILLIEPLALFEPSFQLSFAGTLGILILAPRWGRSLEGKPRALKWAGYLLLTTLAAFLTTLPPILWNFHLFAPAGVVTNPAAVPAVGFGAVPLGLAGAAASFFWPWGAEIFLGLASSLTSAVMGLVEATLALPWLSGWKIYLSPLQLSAVSLGCWALLLPSPPRFRLSGRILPCAATGLLLLPMSSPSTDLMVTALSVGQGESILISGKGRHYLVDGGGLFSDTFDTGERLVAPALARMGVHALDAVVLTHDHPDHRKGLVHVLEHFPVGKFWSSVPIDECHPSIRQVLLERSIPLVRFPPGWTVAAEHPEFTAAVFVPEAEKADSLNDQSLVLYVRSGENGVLLTGDLEESGVIRIIGNPPPGPVNLLKLPHHGSRHAAPGILIDRFEPDMAFLSAGFRNHSGLPHPQVVRGIIDRGIPLFRTDTDGTVRFTGTGEGWSAKRWERGLFR